MNDTILVLPNDAGRVISTSRNPAECPICNEIFESLGEQIYDFTSALLGCPETGRWPGYTASVYLDAVEILQCGCGPAPRIVDLEPLLTALSLEFDTDSEDYRNVPFDPFSDGIYVASPYRDGGSWSVREHLLH